MTNRAKDLVLKGSVAPVGNSWQTNERQKPRAIATDLLLQRCAPTSSRGPRLLRQHEGFNGLLRVRYFPANVAELCGVRNTENDANASVDFDQAQLRSPMSKRVEILSSTAVSIPFVRRQAEEAFSWELSEMYCRCPTRSEEWP